MSQVVDAAGATSLDAGRELVAALAARDWGRLAECFAPDAELHAVVPGTGTFRDRAGAAEAAQQFATWFGDSDPLELLASQVEAVADRVRMSYRFAAFEEGRWHLVEQMGFAWLDGDRIARLDLVCSGFRPQAERPER